MKPAAHAEIKTSKLSLLFFTCIYMYNFNKMMKDLVENIVFLFVKEIYFRNSNINSIRKKSLAEYIKLKNNCAY